MFRFFSKFSLYLALVLLLSSFYLYADADSVSGYVWSSNIGWIKMSGSNYGVDYNSNTGSLSGYAWSPNIGWIRFDGSNTAKALAGGSPEAGGWDGLIRLNGPNFGIDYVKDTVRGCYLNGWAWGSDVIGWIQFTGNNFTTAVSPCELEPQPGDISCSFSASPRRLIRPRNETTLTWSCQNADACSITGVGRVDPEGGSTVAVADQTTTFTLSCSNDNSSFSSSVEVQVFQPTYCEIIPNGPGCEN